MKINISQFQIECRRCGHKWIPRKPEVMLLCTKCKSPYWNIPKKKNQNAQNL